MAKQIKPRWWLQQQVQQIVVGRLGQGVLSPAVHPTEEAYWDAECQGIGHSEWTCGYLAPNGMPSPDAMAPVLSAIGRLQAKYDLAFTAD
jgi:hypothetical protein